jgi:hypothetical protein
MQDPEGNEFCLHEPAESFRGLAAPYAGTQTLGTRITW